LPVVRLALVCNIQRVAEGSQEMMARYGFRLLF